jgi:hypothetical protein
MITSEQAESILPLVQEAVQKQLDQWDYHRAVEKGHLGEDIEGLDALVVSLAMQTDVPEDITADDLQAAWEDTEESGEEDEAEEEEDGKDVFLDS